MGVDNFRQQVNSKLEEVKQEFKKISEEMGNKLLKDRLLELSEQVEILINQTRMKVENLRRDAILSRGSGVKSDGQSGEDLNRSWAENQIDATAKMRIIKPDAEALRAAEKLGNKEQTGEELVRPEFSNVTVRHNHERNISFGGIRQRPPPQEDLNLTNKESNRHDRNTSFGGVMQIESSTANAGVLEVNLDDDLDYNDEEVSHHEEATCEETTSIELKSLVVKAPQMVESNVSKRRVSIGGVMSVESEADRLAAMQSVYRDGDIGQNLVDQELNSAIIQQILPAGKVHLRPEVQKMMEDLAREHLNLKMSKIELIMSTAREIDRLRVVNKLLANQLLEREKLRNKTAGGQGFPRVSDMFGVVTGLFSHSD